MIAAIGALEVYWENKYPAAECGGDFPGELTSAPPPCQSRMIGAVPSAGSQPVGSHGLGDATRLSRKGREEADVGTALHDGLRADLEEARRRREEARREAAEQAKGAHAKHAAARERLQTLEAELRRSEAAAHAARQQLEEGMATARARLVSTYPSFRPRGCTPTSAPTRSRSYCCSAARRRHLSSEDPVKSSFGSSE